jgi:hypothetical protein
MTKISSPLLPQELLDLIVDFLHHDDDALRTISTVSRAFLSSSWRHLFQSLTLNSPRLATLKGRPDAPVSSLPYVRHLRLFCNNFNEPWSNDDLRCLVRLAAVESLSIRHVNWTSVSADTRNTILSNFKHLKDIGILDNRIRLIL